jgi:hypothetical protein
MSVSKHNEGKQRKDKETEDKKKNKNRGAGNKTQKQGRQKNAKTRKGTRSRYHVSRLGGQKNAASIHCECAQPGKPQAQASEMCAQRVCLKTPYPRAQRGRATRTRRAQGSDSDPRAQRTVVAHARRERGVHLCSKPRRAQGSDSDPRAQRRFWHPGGLVCSTVSCGAHTSSAGF